MGSNLYLIYYRYLAFQTMLYGIVCSGNIADAFINGIAIWERWMDRLAGNSFNLFITLITMVNYHWCLQLIIFKKLWFKSV